MPKRSRSVSSPSTTSPMLVHRQTRNAAFQGKDATISRQRNVTAILTMSIAILLSSLIPTSIASLSLPPDYLDTNSVVLITGAAGFIGSELAMALHRVYQPSMIICVDVMDNIHASRTEQDLALLEYKRQRAFHVMQTLGSKGVFYRADFRPSIPEYFDMGEVPILDYIFREYTTISHVVHLADAYHRGSDVLQAVPRIKDDIKAGMMESLLEEIVKVTKETGRMPQYTYASSYEVYNFWNPTLNDPNPPPFHEAKPITTPSSLRGATKLLDEILGRAYYDKHQIFSLGLRFFPVYGPWGLPGTPLFEMAERAITESSTPILTLAEKDSLDDVRDYVYIDDAVDAIMSAMQFRTTSGKPGVVNVGSGEGTTLRDITHFMEDLMPRTVDSEDLGEPSKPATTAIASIERSTLILRFKPQVSLKEGLSRLLAWHYDRAFPHGGRPQEENKNIVSRGVASCLPHDKECLQGAPVYPCVSECSHERQCTPSYYDDILVMTRSLTSQCDAVLYTVALESNLSLIPSYRSNSHLKNKACNIAFVSDASPLVRSLKNEYGYPTVSTMIREFFKMVGLSNAAPSSSMQHGFWTVIPISTTHSGDEHVLKLLPKLSPGLFFGAATRHAVYCDINVSFESIPSLLKEAQMQPFLQDVEGATAMLIGHDAGGSKPLPVNNKESVQNAAYRMIQIGVIEEISSHPVLDSSWMVHTLQNEDSRLFRCDVLGEVIQWDVGTSKSAMEFIVGLHDMWSRVIANGKGQEPWWIGDSVVTVREGANSAQMQRRLTEELVDEEQDPTGEGEINEKTEEMGAEEVNDSLKNEVPDEVQLQPENVKPQPVEVKPMEVNDSVENEAGDIVNGGEVHVESGDTSKGNGDENVDEEVPTTGSKKVVGEPKADQTGNALPGAGVSEVVETPGAFMGADGDKGQPISVGKLTLTGEDGKEDDETTEDEEQTVTSGKITSVDTSVYDTWLGILSSTHLHYFVRIVPSSVAGAVFLDDVTR